MSTTYRMTYNNSEDQVVRCQIIDTSVVEDSVVEIIAADQSPIKSTTIDNDESKFGIKPTKLTIRFFNTTSVNADTFSTGEDGKFQVTLDINTKNVFRGWLEQGDISEPFQYQENQIVTLTAIDGLGYLKDIKYVDFDGVTIVNKFREAITPAKHLARALFQTGLELNINVVDNRREQNNPGVTWFNSCHVFPEFAEDGINGSISCQEVVEKIIGADGFVKQRGGEWWYIRTTELRQDFPTYVTVFDGQGNLITGATEITHEKAIGLKDVNDTPFAGTPDASAFFSQVKTDKSRNRPYKSSELDFPYELPAEILCNSSLVRGDFIADLADEVDEDGNTLTVKSFDTDCWSYLRNVPPDTQDSVEYTKVRYSGGQEKERYIHMEAAANNDFYYLTSQEQIPIALFDKFKIGCSIRYGSDLGGGSGHIQIRQIWVRLYGDDGTFWNLHSVSGTGSSDPSTYWFESDVTWTTNERFCDLEGESQDIDFTLWQILNFEATPCPRSGKLEILLLNNQTASSQTKDFSSLNFEYIPYIDGSYRTITGQSYTATRPGDYRRSIKQDVSISNAPRPLIKGAIKVLLSSSGFDDQFPLAGKFYEGQQFPADDPTSDDLYEFGELQVRAFHNQYRNSDEKYDATSQGLGQGEEDSGGHADQFDLIHRVYLRDLEPSTNNKAFQFVNLDIDWRNCEWRGTLIKNFDTNIGFVDDPVLFQYIGGSFSGSGGGGGGGGGMAPGGRFGVSGEDEIATSNRQFDTNGNVLYIVDGITGIVSGFLPTGLLLGGAVYQNVTRLISAVASYDVVRTDYLITVENNTVDDINLPDGGAESGAGIPNGRVIIFKNISGGAVNINVGNAGDRIYDNSGGFVTTLVISDGKAATLISYGNLWFQVSALT